MHEINGLIAVVGHAYSSGGVGADWMQENRGPGHLTQNINNNRRGGEGEFKWRNCTPNLPL